jgi:spore coat protein A
VLDDFITGPPMPIAPGEAVQKDTVMMLPGTITRIIARFDRAGSYVWHCHIVEHEDNEMMRPLVIMPSTTGP